MRGHPRDADKLDYKKINASGVRSLCWFNTGNSARERTEFPNPDESGGMSQRFALIGRYASEGT
jgi:hypothetical protein